MSFYGRIVIPFQCRSIKSRNPKTLTHPDLKMALRFAIIGSIAATALKLINNAKKIGVLSLNVKKVINLHLR